MIHLVQMKMDAARLARFAAGRGIRAASGELDLGCVVHRWQVERLGDGLLRPFRVLPQAGGSVTVLGYSRQDVDGLRQAITQRGSGGGTPEVSPEQLASKPMVIEHAPGTRLAFELHTAPTRRNGASGTEMDAFVHARTQRPDVTRDQAYGEWLEEKVREAARIEHVSIEQQRQCDVLRGAHRDDGRRRLRVEREVQVTFAGVLEVIDTARFRDLIADGVGRRRAFGQGMLLVRRA